jgi:hypothetical protein
MQLGLLFGTITMDFDITDNDQILCNHQVLDKKLEYDGKVY